MALRCVYLLFFAITSVLSIQHQAHTRRTPSRAHMFHSRHAASNESSLLSVRDTPIPAMHDRRVSSIISSITTNNDQISGWYARIHRTKDAFTHVPRSIGYLLSIPMASGPTSITQQDAPLNALIGLHNPIGSGSVCRFYLFIYPTTDHVQTQGLYPVHGMAVSLMQAHTITIRAP